jgi:hypothetical protein
MREAHGSSTTVVPCFFDLEGVRIMCLWQELRSMKTSAKQTVRIIYTVYWRMCTGWKHHTSCTVLREEKLICRAIATSAKLTWPGYATFRDCLVARCMHESTRRQLYDNYTTTIRQLIRQPIRQPIRQLWKIRFPQEKRIFSHARNITREKISGVKHRIPAHVHETYGKCSCRIGCRIVVV